MNIAMVTYMDFTGPGVMHMHHFANLLVSRGRLVVQPYLNEIVGRTNRSLQQVDHLLRDPDRSFECHILAHKI